jgi:hypothetical protein
MEDRAEGDRQRGGGSANVILDEADRRTARGAAYRDSAEFGLLFDVLDETGARSSQVVRLRGEDVQADFVDPRTGKRQPRLMMPVSRKGGGKKARAFIPVPIHAGFGRPVERPLRCAAYTRQPQAGG